MWFAFIAVVTLALGIGANSAIFALVDATLLRPLPYHDPERLVMMWERSDTSPRGRVSPLNLLDWNERNRTFDLMAGFVPSVGGMVMSGADGTAETVPRQWVTAGFFDVLGVRPIAGRTFLSSDDSQRANVVVLSEAFWRTRFNADPSVVGRDIRLDGSPYTVVGVVPKEFQLFGRSSIWALVSIVRRPALRSAYALQAIGRMKPDVTLEASASDMTAVAEGLAQEFPQTNKGRGVTLEPMHDALIGSELRLTSMLFLGVVLFFEIVGDPPVDESNRPTADYQIVSATYFRTLDLPVIAGRGFNERDTRESVPVCIVNEALVRGHLQGRSPIGLRVAVRPTSSPQEPPVVREIVGVARQVKGRPDETEDLVQIYVPMAQDLMDDTYLVVRPTLERADALAPSVRAAIARVDKEQLVSVRDVMTLEDVAWEATARHRFRAVLVMTFAGLALLLAMVGVFGILAYSVQQRVRDFGVRRALGATTGDLLRLVVVSAVRVIAAGAVIGLALSTLLGRLLATVLFGVRPLDPMTFAAVTIVLFLTAGVSIAGPAWRATRIDPAVALRSQ